MAVIAPRDNLTVHQGGSDELRKAQPVPSTCTLGFFRGLLVALALSALACGLFFVFLS